MTAASPMMAINYVAQKVFGWDARFYQAQQLAQLALK
jgi:hypothetical protein